MSTLSPAQAAVLTLLRKGPMWKDGLDNTARRYAALGTLRALEDRGLIYLRRDRATYGITEAGRAALDVRRHAV